MAGEKDELLDELQAVKKLLILQLLRQGVKQTQIAATLGISESTMSRMLPKGVGKSLAKGAAVSALEGVIDG